MIQFPQGSAASLSGEEGRAFLQERIAYFGRVGFFLTLAFYVLLHVAPIAGRTASRWLDADGLVQLGTVAVLGLVWVIGRGRPWPARGLAALDFAGAFLACLGAALPMVLPEATVDHTYRGLLAISNALIARAAVIPSTAGRSAAVSALAALPTVGLTWLFHTSSGRTADGTALVSTLIAALWCGVAIAVSALTSHTIYGLRLRVREVLQLVQLGQYTLEEKVGEGGMGEVYRARHAMLRRPTAVKLLRPGRSGEEGLKRFEREVQLTSILTHPNTISVFDYGRTADGVFYYAMEYLEGVTLDRLVRQQGPQPAARVVHILRQVCGSLAEAHGIGLIHRDVKPANIILCERGGVPDVVKVFDFGLVQQEGDLASARPDEIAGTPHFLPPEAITAPQSADARSDLYALGAVGYFLLTGTYPFSGRSTAELFAHHLRTAPVPPSVRLGRPVPPGLEAVILQCLEKDPARRPASARECEERLAACSDVGAWTEADARAASSPQASTEENEAAAFRSLTVDLRERTFGPSTLREARRR